MAATLARLVRVLPMREMVSIADSHFVTVDAILAPPRRDQKRPVTSARRAVWRRLEDDGMPVSVIAELWGCDRSTVEKGISRALEGR
jgi:hypothetical protein